MNTDDPRHGTSAGYVAGCREVCCRTAIADWTRHARTRRYLQGELMVDGTGTRRRIRALMALGWATPTIDAEIGKERTYTAAILLGGEAKIRRTTADQYRAAYDRMSMKLPPTETRYQKQAATRVRNYAKRQGWPPPLAWDDDRIDDPNYTPNDWHYQPATRAEMLAELVERGAGITEACRVLKVSRESLQKWCGNHGMSQEFRALGDRELRVGNQWAEDVA